MTSRSQHTQLLAAATLLAILAPSLGGQWCENFESGAATSWSQHSSAGQWQHTTYTEEARSGGGNMPKPTTGQDGMLLLRRSNEENVASSRLVSPKLAFSDGASIELTYWLWYMGAGSQVDFLLYRLVDGIEDKKPFLNITSYSTGHDSGWSSLEVGLNLDKGNTIQIAIYGYLAGDSTAMIALDRVMVRGVVNGQKACGAVHGMEPTDEPEGPDGPILDFFCPSYNGIFMDPADCRYFYNCAAWRAYHMVCPSDLVFNAITDQCDYLRNVPRCEGVISSARE